MTENLQAFFAQNVEKPEFIEHKVSDRFPLFKFKAITPNKDAEIKTKCQVKKKIVDGPRKGQQEVDFLAGKYQNLMTIESMVFPNLHDQKLQDSWGVMDAEQLFDKMFNPAEATEAFIGAQKANGYSVGFDELVEQAKN